MAFGTPVVGGTAFSGGTSVAVAYPTGLTATTAILMFIGQKPTTANGGTVTTPTGWTLVDSLTGAGGYGGTTGTDVGNTNLFVYRKDVVTGTETGNLTVTLGGNNVAWAFMVRTSYAAGNTVSYGSADGQRTTAPTAGTPFAVALTNGATPPNLQSGDLAIWAMCIPTDVTTPAQFSAQSVTATGTTFATAVELNEPDSATGNDIGGYSAYALATAGSSTTAPTVTVTAAGTVTNVRGPIVLVRLREVAIAAQTLTPALYTNTNSFFSPTVTAAGPTQTLTPALYSNTNTFLSATVTRSNTLTPARYDNGNTFYSATVTAGTVTLSPARYDNGNTFYSATVTQSGAPQTLTPALYTNGNTFYAASVSASNTIAPDRYDNTNTFYAATVTQSAAPQTLTPALYTNDNTFYAATVASSNTLTPARYDNGNTFYAAAVTAGTVTLSLGPYVDDGYVDTGYIGLSLQNINTFYSPTVTIASTSSGNMFLMFFP